MLGSLIAVAVYYFINYFILKYSLKIGKLFHKLFKSEIHVITEVMLLIFMYFLQMTSFLKNKMPGPNQTNAFYFIFFDKSLKVESDTLSLTFYLFYFFQTGKL